MRKYVLFLVAISLISCQKDDEIIEPTPAPTPTPTPSTAVELESVSFLKSNNPSLFSDIELHFDGEDTFSGHAEWGVTIKELVATYDYEGSSIKIGETNQVNSITQNDFSKETVVRIIGDNNGNSKEYKIRLTYHTGLPIVYINTNDFDVMSKEDYMEAEISIYGGLNYDDVEDTTIQIRGRGNTTWVEGNVLKKPYQIKFEDKQEILDMPDDRRWVLLAEFWDRSMIRNKLSFEFGQISNFDYSPQGRYVEVIFNGLPSGTYVIAQKVEESTNRVNIGDNGYLVEMDQEGRIKETDVYFTPQLFREKLWETFTWNPNTVFNIKEPKNIISQSAEYELIVNHVNNFESVLFGSEFKDEINGYRPFIDVDSFVDWYVINEIGKSVDAYGYASVFFNYVPGEKIKMGPIWDFDLSFGNADYSVSAFYVEGNHINQHPWFKRLLEDDYFRLRVQERFNFIYGQKHDFLNKIDEFASHIDKSQKLNYDLYQNLGQLMWNHGEELSWKGNSSPETVFATYEEEVSYLKSWLRNRLDWMNNDLN